MTRRPWLVPATAGLAAVAFLAAGVIAWRMYALPRGFVGYSNRNSIGVIFTARPHRLHPLRAELLWIVSGLLALVAVVTGLRAWPRPGRVPPADA